MEPSGEEQRERRESAQTSNGDHKEEQDRLLQVGLEYWKADYDFHKHLVTVCFAAIVGFGALLGGVFRIEDSRFPDGLMETDGLIESIQGYRVELMALVFGFFILSAILATVHMRQARKNIADMRNVPSSYDKLSSLNNKKWWKIFWERKFSFFSQGAFFREHSYSL